MIFCQIQWRTVDNQEVGKYVVGPPFTGAGYLLSHSHAALHVHLKAIIHFCFYYFEGKKLEFSLKNIANITSEHFSVSQISCNVAY